MDQWQRHAKRAGPGVSPSSCAPQFPVTRAWEVGLQFSVHKLAQWPKQDFEINPSGHLKPRIRGRDEDVCRNVQHVTDDNFDLHPALLPDRQ